MQGRGRAQGCKRRVLKPLTAPPATVAPFFRSRARHTTPISSRLMCHGYSDDLTAPIAAMS